jgi:hypothetical protein
MIGAALWCKIRGKDKCMRKGRGFLYIIFFAIGIITILRMTFSGEFNIKRLLCGAVFIGVGLFLYYKKRPYRYIGRRNEYVVYISQTGSKYHSTSDCPKLRAGRLVRELPMSEAIQSGLEPCETCRP